MKFYLQLFLSILVLQLFNSKKIDNNPFKKVIVLMMENHSYDNMLGYMDFPIGEVKGNEKCNEHKGVQYCQRSPSQYQTKPDPGHIFPQVNHQLYNSWNYPSGIEETPNMEGFSNDYGLEGGDPQQVMDIFAPEQVPIISTLAEQFTTYTNWYSSVPSQTNPNKVFMHAATSGGNLFNCQYWYCSGWPYEAETIQTKLQEEGYSWSIHWMDWCEAMGISPMNSQFQNFHNDQEFKEFFEKLEKGDIDDYTYLVPRIVGDHVIDEQGEYIRYPPNTQHPSEDIRNGELLIKQVYENFRKSPRWEDTLLLIVYDEHGGFYDHKVPPMNVVNPTPQDPSGPFGWQFTFERLGVRVPSIAISPWMKKGVDDRQLEHSSIPHTIHDIFDLQNGYLNKRDESTLPFLTGESFVEQIRQDCPMTLPEVPPFDINNPEKKTYENSEFNGGPKSQVELLGTMLVQKGLLNTIKYKQIYNKLKNDIDAIQFAKEAQYILGYRNLKSVSKFKYLSQSLRNQQDE